MGCLRTRPCDGCASCTVGLKTRCIRMFCEQVIMMREDILQTLQEEIERRTTDRTPLTFMASLSCNSPEGRRHTSVTKYFMFFDKFKNQLARKLFVMFNQTMDYQLPSNTRMEWNRRFTTTGGTCHFTTEKGNVRTARIELGSKIVDRPERLRDVLAYEVAHAAAWVINGTYGGHGIVWRQWADHLTQAYPEIPHINITHDYDIHYRYWYECLRCKKQMGRHRKYSENNDLKCQHCFGKIKVINVIEDTLRLHQAVAKGVKQCLDTVYPYSQTFKGIVKISDPKTYERIAKDYSYKIREELKSSYECFDKGKLTGIRYTPDYQAYVKAYMESEIDAMTRIHAIRKSSLLMPDIVRLCVKEAFKKKKKTTIPVACFKIPKPLKNVKSQKVQSDTISSSTKLREYEEPISDEEIKDSPPNTPPSSPTPATSALELSDDDEPIPHFPPPVPATASPPPSPPAVPLPLANTHMRYCQDENHSGCVTAKKRVEKET